MMQSIKALHLLRPVRGLFHRKTAPSGEWDFGTLTAISKLEKYATIANATADGTEFLCDGDRRGTETMRMLV